MKIRWFVLVAFVIVTLAVAAAVITGISAAEQLP